MLFHLVKLTCTSFSAGAAGNFLAPITGLSANAFKSVIDIDVLGSYNTLKATLPALLASASKHRDSSQGLHPHPNGTGGRIIFVSATIHYQAQPLQVHVGVAKAGVDVLSHTVAIEFGPKGLTSNIISPGPIMGTEGMERLSVKEDREDGMKVVPVGRCTFLNLLCSRLCLREGPLNADEIAKGDE